MNLSGVNARTTSYSDIEATTTPNTKPDTSASETDKKDPATSDGAVYDKTPADSDQKATYKINKMSAEQRAELVKKLKSEQTNRENQLLDIVNKMISKQANTFTKADDNFWKIFTQKSINIDPDTNFESIKAKAKEDISEDGYYGVKQTSQRLFDFASALAGDDVDKMKDMQKAMEKGFKQAEKLWGGDKKLPKISYETKDAVNKMFDDYYKSKEKITEDTVAKETA